MSHRGALCEPSFWSAFNIRLEGRTPLIILIARTLPVFRLSVFHEIADRMPQGSLNTKRMTCHDLGVSLFNLPNE